MTEIFIVVPMFTFIFLIIMEALKNNNTRKILKIYAENGILNNGSGVNHNIDLNLNNRSGNKNITLPLSLGLMGLSLGLFFIFIIKINYMTMGYNSNFLELSLPVFFGALGLLIAYIIERKNSK